MTSVGVALTRIGHGRDTTGMPPFGFCGEAARMRCGQDSRFPILLLRGPRHVVAVAAVGLPGACGAQRLSPLE
ncbi:MAG: hypothetical protein ACRDTA_18980 [Pseudonocardiaceae bacterium]